MRLILLLIFTIITFDSSSGSFHIDIDISHNVETNLECHSEDATQDSEDHEKHSDCGCGCHVHTTNPVIVSESGIVINQWTLSNKKRISLYYSRQLSDYKNQINRPPIS